MRYRLLCCSDTHGQAPPEIDDSGATAWLHAGDVYNGPDILDGDEKPLPEDPIAEPIRAWLRARRAPVYGTHGNHDVADPYSWFEVATAMDGRIERIAPNLLLAGVGWNGERYFELPLESDLEKICERALRQFRRLSTSADQTILLTHYPPRISGVFPLKRGAATEPGYQALNGLIGEIAPVLIVQGHEHFWFKQTARIDLGSRQSLVINPGPEGMAVVIDNDTVQTVPLRA